MIGSSRLEIEEEFGKRDVKTIDFPVNLGRCYLFGLNDDKLDARTCPRRRGHFCVFVAHESLPARPAKFSLERKILFQKSLSEMHSGAVKSE